MKAIDRPFTKIINGTTQFVIPVFQRDYSWTETQCEQLWKDVLLIANDPTGRGHFMGSVVYVSTGDTSAGFTRWLLIDGQQRVAGALKSHCDVKSDNLSLSFPTATALEKIEELIRGIQADAVRPIPDADAMENLKFSECLSPSIAAEVFVSRFDDRAGVTQALAEPRRLVKHG